MQIFRTAVAALFVISGVVSAAEEHPAQTLVQSTTETVLQVLSENSERVKTDAAFLRETIVTHIEPSLDFTSMTKLAVGKNWKKANTEQRDELVKQFRLLLLNTYSNALTQYSGQAINFLPYRESKREDRAVVRSEFEQSGGAAIPISYKLLNKGSWKIYDIAIDGISLVTNYRTGFNNKIKKDGIDGLIQELSTKNAGSAS
ncbi:MAG: ABC transporter substrate-binding protein [Pseudomonadota bacterium]